MEETKKAKKVNNLAYTALKYFPGFALSVLRQFALTEFTKDFDQWLCRNDIHKCKHRVKLRSDGSKGKKKYGNMIPEIDYLWDYVNRCYSKTHEFYIEYVSIGRKDYVVDFHLVKKKERTSTKKKRIKEKEKKRNNKKAVKKSLKKTAKENGKKLGSKELKKLSKSVSDKNKQLGSNKIARQMTVRFLRSLGRKRRIEFLKYCRLSLDGAWGNGKMLRYIKRQGFVYNAVKSGGKDKITFKNHSMSLKDFELYLADNGIFKKFDDRYKLKGEYSYATVVIKAQQLSIRVLLRRFESESKGYRYLMILSTNLNLRMFQIAQCYESRWGIEECFKECKQIVDLTKYSFHSKATTKDGSNAIDNVEMFLALRFICYMSLNWYRAEYCRPSKTSMWKVAKQFENYFMEIGYKGVWHLIS